MRNIAIVRRNGLGDLLCALPLVLYFRKHFPEDKITLFVDAKNAALLPYSQHIGDVVVFPAKGNKYLNSMRTALKCRLRHFDIAICAKTSPMKLMNIFLYALGAKKRCAYVDQSWSARLINAPAVFDEKRCKRLHQALKGLHLVNPELNEVPEELYPTLSVPEALMKTHCGETSAPPKLPRLLLSASTTRLASRLDPKRYACLVNRLYEHSSFSVHLVGQLEDRARAEAIAAYLKVPHQIHFPRNFEAFMVLLNLCDLYFIGDGGIGHIGAALGKRAVVLFGETNPIEWHPLSRKVHCFYHPVHVNCLSEETIFAELERNLREIHDGRHHL